MWQNGSKQTFVLLLSDRSFQNLARNNLCKVFFNSCWWFIRMSITNENQPQQTLTHTEQSWYRPYLRHIRATIVFFCCYLLAVSAVYDMIPDYHNSTDIRHHVINHQAIRFVCVSYFLCCSIREFWAALVGLNFSFYLIWLDSLIILPSNLEETAESTTGLVLL